MANNITLCAYNDGCGKGVANKAGHCLACGTKIIFNESFQNRTVQGICSEMIGALEFFLDKEEIMRTYHNSHLIPNIAYTKLNIKTKNYFMFCNELVTAFAAITKWYLFLIYHKDVAQTIFKKFGHGITNNILNNRLPAGTPNANFNKYIKCFTRNSKKPTPSFNDSFDTWIDWFNDINNDLRSCMGELFLNATLQRGMKSTHYIIEKGVVVNKYGERDELHRLDYDHIADPFMGYLGLLLHLCKKSNIVIY